MKTKVFKRAHRLASVTGKGFSVCLAKSWALLRLQKQMERGVVRFAYERMDGSLRKAHGTLKDVEHLIKGIRSGSEGTIRYFDIDANAFRSFRIENFITIYP